MKRERKLPLFIWCNSNDLSLVYKYININANNKRVLLYSVALLDEVLFVFIECHF